MFQKEYNKINNEIFLKNEVFVIPLNRGIQDLTGKNIF